MGCFIGLFDGFLSDFIGFLVFYSSGLVVLSLICWWF